MTTSPTVEAQREMLTLVTARIRDAYVRKPFYVDGALDLVSVCRALREHGSTHALVRDHAADGSERLGIFTTTDLRDALLRDVPPAAAARCARWRASTWSRCRPTPSCSRRCG